MNNTDNFFSISNLVVEYTSGGDVIHAVNGVSLKIEKGKTLGIVGETGSGKTSIAKSILRILPSPQGKIKNGEIYFKGQNLLELSETEMTEIRGSSISMIFQDPMTALNPTMTIGEQIAEVVRLHSNDSKEKAKDKAVSILNRVGIMADRYNNYPFEFSGGMKQRVVIAMALVFKPDLLLADEPTTALDVTIQAQILDIIRHYKEKFETSMILITHDLGIVAENCDYVAVIYAGQILEQGEKGDIFDCAAHPYTIGLFMALPDFAIGEKRLHVIEGAPPDPRKLPDGCVFSPRCKHSREECRCGEIPFKEVSPGHYCRCLYPEVKK